MGNLNFYYVIVSDKNMRNNCKIRVASLFCGCGGTDVGILGGFKYLGRDYQRLDTSIVYANDIDEKIADIFDLNFHIKVDRRDIRNIKASDVPAHDLLTAGFPCQSFSILAQNPPRLGVKDEKGTLFFEIIRILKYHKPKLFICENVKGLLSANGGKTFPLILKELENCGYSISHQLLNSRHYGIPQKRERIFIVGIRKDLPAKPFIFPAAINNDLNSVPLKLVLDDTFPIKYVFSKKAIDGMIRSNNESNAKMNKGRVQSPDEPCNTVTAHLSKITLNGTDPVLAIGTGFRRFTPREVARIQSFPEEFKLAGPDFHQYKALGNAIPPVLFWHMAKNILALYDSIPAKSKKTELAKHGAITESCV